MFEKHDFESYKKVQQLDKIQLSAKKWQREVRVFCTLFLLFTTLHECLKDIISNWTEKVQLKMAKEGLKICTAFFKDVYFNDSKNNLIDSPAIYMSAW